MTDIQKENKSGGKVPNLRFPSFEGEWEVKKLGEIAEKIGDGLHGTPSYTDESNYYFINGNNLINGKIEITENTKKIDAKTFLKNDKNLRKNTLLISINGTIGNIAKYNNENVMLGKSVGYFNFEENSDFLYFVLQTSPVQEHFKSELTGSTIKNLSLKTLRETNLRLPSQDEQQKVASFLSLIDERITTQSKIIKELKTLKASTAKKIFSQELRFKDDNGNIFSEWEVREVGEVFKITRGNVLAMNLVSNQCNEKNTYPVYSSQTKNNGLAGYYTDFLFEDAITWTTDGANAGDVNYRSGKFYCTNVCGVLISNEGYANSCIAELINSVSKNYVSYVGNPKLMNGVMSEIKIPFPSLPEQTKIANFLSAIDSKIDMENQLLQKLEEQKKYLLQNMFV